MLHSTDFKNNGWLHGIGSENKRVFRCRCPNPLKTEIQSDGRIRKWSYIEEAGKYLRVILLDDGETVHNAFFDRGFKEGEK